MPETELWIWIVVSVVALIALVVSVGNHLQNRRSPTQQEYWRAQGALKTYEEQQQIYDEHQARTTQILDRQQALLDRIERLVERLEERYRAKPGS